MAEYTLNTSEIKDFAKQLRAGDRVLLSGTVYTSRDAAHKRIKSLIDSGKELPYDLSGAVIYYAGPTPTPEGLAIGSCGPTTSGRMDKFAPEFLDLGLSAMIGKGPRTSEVCEAIVRNNAVYFCAVGGAGAILSKCIKASEVIAYDDLGTEAIRKLTVKDFPVIVVIDKDGNNLYEINQKRC